MNEFIKSLESFTLMIGMISISLLVTWFLYQFCNIKSGWVFYFVLLVVPVLIVLVPLFVRSFLLR
jgi:hypothetical protein